ncbi:Beta-glucanase [Dactylella cylindrospora]|nr:Beta-glucanase [Dactylella cylindrospora]
MNSSVESHQEKLKGTFKSYRLRGEYPQPWRQKKQSNHARNSNFIIYGFFLLGAGISAYLCYDGYRKFKRPDYCLILDDGFETLDPNIWHREVQLDGFGVGSFDWTTTDDANSYITPSGLAIMPTLTNLTTGITVDKIVNGYTLNLTRDGSCTNTRNLSTCFVSSNSTTGRIINPVRTARLTTKLSRSIKYGRVEVTVKMPKGDWLMPSVRLFPVKDVYGDWPRSGSIDIVQSRGNPVGYEAGGRDIVTSTLHWGVSRLADRFWKTTGGRKVRHTDFTKGFHTFGVEWSKDYIFTYHNGQTFTVMWVGLNEQSFWEMGQFANNGTLRPNPWAISPNKHAPFDQDFYLSLSLQVGATNGWFPDARTGKPWIDRSSRAAGDFWSEVNAWYPTWGQGEGRAMIVRNVKMWQEGKC